MDVEYAKKVLIDDYTDERFSHYGVVKGRTEGEDIIVTLEHMAFIDNLPKEYFGYEVKYELKPSNAKATEPVNNRNTEYDNLSHQD